MRLSRSNLKISRSQLEISIVATVLFVYAGFGDPTPDGVSWSEIVQAAGLIFLVLIGHSSTRKGQHEPAFFLFLWFALIVGLSSSFANDIRQILRDVIAHMFFCFAVFWPRRLSSKEITWLMSVFSLAGGIIAFRFLIETGFSFSALDATTRFSFDGFLKLNTDPLVTFSAGYGIVALFDKRRLISTRGIIFSFSLISMMAIGLSALRGPMAIVCVVAVVTLLRARIYRSWAGLLVFVVLLYFVMLNANLFGIFLDNFVAKMTNAGTSAKWNEFSHVMTTAGSDFISFFFGSGFGAKIDVGGRSLPFTHNALSYYFAKTGVIGLMFLLLFILGLVHRIVVTRKLLDPEVALLIVIFLYGLTINPHYKYLTFGLVITLLLKKTERVREKRTATDTNLREQALSIERL